MLAVYLREMAAGKRRGIQRDLLPETDLTNRSYVVASKPMDKKEINSPKMTLNFLIWVGGVFMLLLFALLAHFVWKLF